MQLNPGEKFVITHQIGDHTDTSTYYVEAVIRNGVTDVVIDTVQLVDRGNRRFSQEWQVPGDPSGQGFYISITTTVYTDSGYSTKAPLYSEEQERLLVQTRTNPNIHGYGAGSGPDIDYKKINKMIEDNIKKIKFPEPKEVKIPAFPITDLEPVHDDIYSLRQDMVALRDLIVSLPRFEKTKIDFTEIMGSFTSLASSIEKLEVFIANIYDKRSNELVGEIDDSIKTRFQKMANDVNLDLRNFREEIKESMSTVSSTEEKGKEEKEKKPQKSAGRTWGKAAQMSYDISHILRKKTIRKKNEQKK